MMLSLDADKRLGALHLQARFTAPAGATALFGPSGAGKTSLVNMIAGLLRPDRGRIVLADEVLFDSEAGIDVAPNRRRIGYVFQEGRLFPHLTVRQNLAYGRWMRGLPRDPDEEERVVALLGLGALLARRPGRLSGGERQRVAIARAFMSSATSLASSIRGARIVKPEGRAGVDLAAIARSSHGMAVDARRCASLAWSPIVRMLCTQKPDRTTSIRLAERSGFAPSAD